MDDLMNKVGALIEEHVKGEVDARRVLEPSKDEIRRGARALGFWEKLVETLSDGRVEDANFDDVMAKIGALKERCDEWQCDAEASKKQVEHLCKRITAVRGDRDRFVKERNEALDNWYAVTKCLWGDGRQGASKESVVGTISELRAGRDSLVAQLRGVIAKRDEYSAMWEQLHRAQGEDLDAKEQLKELLSTLGLAHFDRNTIAGAIEATRKRDARLVSERDTAKAQLEVACAKVRELDAKLLEVRIAIAP